MNKEIFLEMIAKGRTYKVTDIHLSVDEFPIFRVNDKIYRFEEYEALTKEGIESLAEEILTFEEKERLDEEKEIDLSFRDLSGNCRINIFYERGNLSFAVRIIRDEIPTIEELNLSVKVNDFFDERQGLIIVCGKTSSGKTSTISAMLNKYNNENNYNILTLEDPIEYIHKNNKSIIRQREIGKDVKSYKEGIKSALRQNVDVIMIGELRDRESVEMALTAAETGHIVITTLHSNSVIDTVDRLIGMFGEEKRDFIQRLVALNLIGIIHQEFTTGIDDEEQPIKVPICEIMYMNSGIQNLIKNGKISQISSFIDVSGRKGMLNKQESIKELYRAKRFTTEQFEKEIKNLRKI